MEGGTVITAQRIKAALDFEAFYRQELGELKLGANGNAKAVRPFHGDTEPLLPVDLKDGLFNCFGFGASGDVIDFYQRSHGVDFKTALRELACFAGQEPEAEDQRGEEGLTLEAFAEAKRLPIDFLQEHGVKGARGKDGRPYVVFEYRGLDGKVIPEATRMRFSMAERPIARRGGKPELYGLWRRVELLAEEGELLLLEGESDTLTAWLHGLPAVGGAWQDPTQNPGPGIFPGLPARLHLAGNRGGELDPGGGGSAERLARLAHPSHDPAPRH
jgi:DNA primase